VIKVSPQAPLWARQLVTDINRELNRSGPVRLPEFADSAALPSASDYRSHAVFKKDIDMICVSDGTDWRRVDTGATV